jgi:hypothetical protein
MGSDQTTSFPDLLARLTRELDGRAIPFMLIGGQAVLLHGTPRLTEDIDVTLGVDPGQNDRSSRAPNGSPSAGSRCRSRQPRIC